MTSRSFVRVIKRKEVLALAFGAIIGWSWVVLTGGWIDRAGSLGAILGFLVGGMAVVLVGFTYAELASAMPQVGGEHVYSRRALGESASFICTWAILLGYVSVVAFEAVALPTVAEYLVPGFSRGYLWTIAGWDVEATWILLAVVAAVLMTAVNIVGIRTAARLQMLVSILIVAGGLALVAGVTMNGSFANALPVFEQGIGGMLGVLVVVPLMLVGFDVIPQSAEEIDLPFSEIGRLLMVAIVIAVLWYVAMIMAVSVALTPAERATSSLPTADAASAALGGGWGGTLLVIAGIGGILTSWNAFLIGGSRAMYALAKAGQLPAWLGVLHPRYNTPHRAVLLIGFFSILAPFFGRQAMVWLVDAGSFGIIVAYAFVALSFLVLRYREPEMPRPYALRFWKFTGFAALMLSLAIVLLFLPGSPAALIWPWEWAIVGGWALLGAVLLAAARRRIASN
jgi:amino acid transporter